MGNSIAANFDLTLRPRKKLKDFLSSGLALKFFLWGFVKVSEEYKKKEVATRNQFIPIIIIPYLPFFPPLGIIYESFLNQ